MSKKKNFEKIEKKLPVGPVIVTRPLHRKQHYFLRVA